MSARWHNEKFLLSMDTQIQQCTDPFVLWEIQKTVDRLYTLDKHKTITLMLVIKCKIQSFHNSFLLVSCHENWRKLPASPEERWKDWTASKGLEFRTYFVRVFFCLFVCLFFACGEIPRSRVQSCQPLSTERIQDILDTWGSIKQMVAWRWNLLPELLPPCQQNPLPLGNS